VAQDHTVFQLNVSVNITHQDTTELIVELTSPDATTVRLHDQSDPPGSGIHFRYDLDLAPDGPGAMSDFIGETTLGTWTLSIEDSVAGFAGQLTDWTLHFTIDEGWDCVRQTCGDATPTTAVDNLVVDTSGGGTNLELAWDAVGGVSGYHVLQSTAAPFNAGVDLSGTTAGPTTLSMTNGVNLTPDLTFFQVKAVNSCNQEGP
jgi:subtilisin-like proprotein convertase family protein